MRAKTKAHLNREPRDLAMAICTALPRVAMRGETQVLLCCQSAGPARYLAASSLTEILFQDVLLPAMDKSDDAASLALRLTLWHELLVAVARNTYVRVVQASRRD